MSGGTRMRFGVLGPLQVISGDAGEPTGLSAARLRALLAVLLWQAGRPVPPDELAELVWDGAPPAGTREAIRALVMRLRRALGEPAGTRIVARPAGYAIEVGDGELDATLFEALTGDAGTAVRERRWPEVARSAAAALELWRGEPLADVPSQLLRDQWAPRLERLHLQALEWRIEADLHEDRHRQLVPELRELTAAYPLREHFHGQLMLALVRSGRQAEALSAYQDARQALADRLGVDPGPELRRLHERILAEDPALQPGPETLTAAEATVPRQLPAVARWFTGRKPEIDVLTALAEQESGSAETAGTVVIAAIDGMAGVGKTALAVQAAHRLAGQFPDGQLFIDMHGFTQGHRPRSANEALAAFLRALGVPPGQVPEETEERAALFRQRLAGTRTLIVLDNAASEAQVRPLIPGEAGCLVLVTSRRRLKGLDDAHVLALDVLPDPDAVTLFCHVAGPGRVLEDQPALAEAVELCGRLPLALRIAAALLRHRPAWTLAQLTALLREGSGRNTALSDGERDLDTVFGLSYDSLGLRQQRMFRLLGLIPGPDFDRYAGAALAGTDPVTAGRLLEDLVDHNLLLQAGPDRYRLHDLLRLHARTLAGHDPVSESEAARNRLLDYYQHTAGRADRLVAHYPRPAPAGQAPAHAPAFGEEGTAWAWLRAERPSLLAALKYAAGAAQYERVGALTAGLATLVRVDGLWSTGLVLQSAAAAAARTVGDRSGEAAVRVELSIIRLLTCDYPAALAESEQALRLYTELGEPLGQANAMAEMGWIRFFDSDLTRRADLVEEALRLYQDLDEPLGQANALTYLGTMRCGAGDHREAAGILDRARSLYQRLGRRDGEANAMVWAGRTRLLAGDLAGATRTLNDVLELFGQLGQRLGQAYALCYRGELHWVTGDYPAAARDLEEALRLHQDLESPVGRAGVIANLGSVRLALGDLPAALRLHREAVDIFRRVGSPAGEAWALNRYAPAVGATGDHAAEEETYRTALSLARQTRQLDDEALALEGLGECGLRRGEHDAATANLRQALEIFDRISMTPGADRVRARLAGLPGERAGAGE